MQGLSSKGCERISSCFRELGRLGLEARSVDRITQQWVTDMGEVDADLVGPAGLQFAGEQARDRLAVGSRKSLKLLPVGYGLAAICPHCHLVAGVGMAAERLVDGAAGAVRGAPYKGEIATPHRPGAAVVCELARQ